MNSFFDELRDMSDEEKLDLIMILVWYVLDSAVDIRELDISDRSKLYAVAIIDKFKEKFFNGE